MGEGNKGDVLMDILSRVQQPHAEGAGVLEAEGAEDGEGAGGGQSTGCPW